MEDGVGKGDVNPIYLPAPDSHVLSASVITIALPDKPSCGVMDKQRMHESTCIRGRMKDIEVRVQCAAAIGGRTYGFYSAYRVCGSDNARRKLAFRRTAAL